MKNNKLLFLLGCLFLNSCSSIKDVTSNNLDLAKDNAKVISQTNTAYVFYYNDGTLNADGSYKYQTEGRTIIKSVLEKKGYKVEFVSKNRQGTLFIEINQNDGSDQYSYRSEQTVGTVRDRSGNTVYTYNEPVTKYRSKSWTRVSFWIYDPSNTYSATPVCHKDFTKTGGNYMSRFESLLSRVMNSIPKKMK